jgi:hypothetical protein
VWQLANAALYKKSSRVPIIIGLFRKSGILDKYFSEPVK